MFEDKKLTCKTCHQQFTFTAPEQEFFAKKEFSEPQRCPECRYEKRVREEKREVFPAICAKCGRETVIPFQPIEERPVFCRNCFYPSRREFKGEIQ
ncbi:CxxC-x17-CxxC domain-containing protein [Desulfosporosinus sp. SB140]|uniref:CxxC-x17-CxxC domain-containing protein n=1 Tax=Desulfosporosinus paludis TaxID=3115649 RepID=UPI00388D70EC